MRNTCIALASFFAVATAAPRSLRHVAAPAVPFGWASTPVETTNEVKFTIVVNEQGRDEIKRIAHAVSDPRSATYGEFLSQAQLDEIIAPTASDMNTVTSWIESSGLSYTLSGISNVVVSGPMDTVSTLLNTEFHLLHHAMNNMLVVRAKDYVLPADVAAATTTVLGLHGLPLPPRAATIGAQPVAVTPDVLNTQYGISGVKTTGSLKNRQAVAEFQGQFMNSTDLKNLFKTYVKSYKAGVDDVVYAWHGKHEENSGGVEAELDIQYIMGVSVGVKTEFWEFPSSDFCNDLNQWTSNLTSTADVPLVHSVSYGWQGNLSQIGCHPADVKVVDDNFAKLAAKGVSIMISSGDSGSGYSSQTTCAPGKPDTAVVGTVDRTIKVQEEQQCCEEATQAKAKAWTFVASHHLEAAPTGAFNFKDAEFHAEMGSGVIKTRDEYTLNGKINKAGGEVKVHCLNGTFKDTTVTFGPSKKMGGAPEYERNVTATFGGTKFTGRALFIAFPGQPEECVNFEWKAGHGTSVWERGNNPPPPPPPGTCVLYSKFTKTEKGNSSTFSGEAAAAPKAPVLWASWPASSPWVTAVGATRFVGQKVGNAEMATDQFGSGGGFSTMWEQSPDATFQSAAVAKYLKTVDASTLPPAASFDAKARATPDVSALGEGYQVSVGGHFEGVGGTSASSPAFAGMVSMLNEARLNAGKKQMGFLNPFLYQNEDAFTDVVLGSNKIGRGGQPLPYGFNCSKGWDPATGLGTPKFQALLKAAMGPDM